ncbi:MAG: dienelactone hydrolase family protein [Pseudomonadota bacterium]|nr:dienelactone hydrolase family protein [Gammaproteobacteria bacterium]MDQ3582185.1 dienelactone hydrolase family protein [Pseudomonadota bacterium]
MKGKARQMPNVEKLSEKLSMSNETFVSAKTTYKITIYPAPSDGKKHPVILLVHGNFGLGDPYGAPIHGFAKDLAGLGYMTAVPQYYEDDDPHLTDKVPHVQTLADATAAVASRPGADPKRLGLIGFSLGAATAMTFIASKPSGTVKVLADFFGFLTPTIEAAVLSFPPTIILHNKNDEIVKVSNSKKLNQLLPSTIDHELVTYDERWQIVNHAFEPGGTADVDSRSKTTAWFTKYLPPTGN